MSRSHHSDYDEKTTGRCERTLVTLLGDIGPWREHVYLAGGLAPRYIVGDLAEGSRPHVGTTDVDLVIGLALDDAPETYRTLENNLRKAHFRYESSFRCVRSVDGVKVVVEFLCETDAVEQGRIYNPKGENIGSGLGALNVRGAQLLTRDYLERSIEAERLDDGGRSRVVLRVANVQSYTVLKTLAFQDRHENKDAYDLIFCLLNYGEGPGDAGRAASTSTIINDPTVVSALALLADRFGDVGLDGPAAYGAFLADPGDADHAPRLRQEAVAVVREFLATYRLGEAEGA